MVIPIVSIYRVPKVYANFLENLTSSSGTVYYKWIVKLKGQLSIFKNCFAFCYVTLIQSKVVVWKQIKYKSYYSISSLAIHNSKFCISQELLKPFAFWCFKQLCFWWKGEKYLKFCSYCTFENLKRPPMHES